MRGGFTLIEIGMAITIMALGVVGIYALVPRITSVALISNNQFIASQLAKEGLEIVRNIRDSNWLAGDSFNNNLAEGDWLVQYDTQAMLPYIDEFLRISTDGFYNYTEGEITKFKRKITLCYLDAYILNIKVQVNWVGKGSPFEIQENLYDWK